MAAHTYPGLGLKGGWEYGEDGWNVGMDENLLRLSVYAHILAAGTASAVPSSGADGLVTLITGGGNAGNIAVIDAGSVHIVQGYPGMRAYSQADGTVFVRTGSTWVPDPVIALSSRVAALEAAPAGSGHSVMHMTATDNLPVSAFSGGVTVLVSGETDISIGVPAGVEAAHPVTVIRTGPGGVSITPGEGVELLAADDQVSARARYSAMTLIPTAQDQYALAGDLA